MGGFLPEVLATHGKDSSVGVDSGWVGGRELSFFPSSSLSSSWGSGWVGGWVGLPEVLASHGEDGSVGVDDAVFNQEGDVRKVGVVDESSRVGGWVGGWVGGLGGGE